MQAALRRKPAPYHVEYSGDNLFCFTILWVLCYLFSCINKVRDQGQSMSSRSIDKVTLFLHVS